MLLAVPVLLLLLLSPTSVQGATAARKAHFLRRDVVTLPASQQLQRLDRRLASAHGSQQGLFLLGCPPSHQESVAQDLKSLGGRVLYAVPTHHWIITASRDALSALSSRHDGLTVADLPSDVRMGPGIDASTMSAYSTQGAGAAATPSFPPPSPDAQQTPAKYQNLQTSWTTDGKLQLVLRVTGVGAVGAPILAATPQGAAQAGQQRAAVQAWAAQLQSALRDVLGYGDPPTSTCAPEIYAPEWLPVLRVKACIPDVAFVTQWCSKQPGVLWVDTMPRYTARNMQAAIGVQGVDVTQPQVELTPLLTPYWNVGLDGTGQIIATADSGLDMDSCFFWDPNFVNFNQNPDTDPITGFPMFNNSAHRKVALYYAQRLDFLDNAALDGHGTHVSGTMVGSVYGFDNTSPTYATGIAPGAKIAFFDMLGASDGEFYEPPDNPQAMYEVMYRQGARVVSNSWGLNGAYTYTMPDCYLLDAYLYARPDMAVFFAAGNDGYVPNLAGSTGSVGSPATCKNVIAVGASDNWVPLLKDTETLDLLGPGGVLAPPLPTTFFGRDPSSVDNRLVFTSNTPKVGISVQAPVPDPNVVPDILLWSYQGGSAPTLSQLDPAVTYEVVAASPPNACGLSSPAAWTGKVVIFLPGGCDPSVKAANLAAGGAAAGISISSDSTSLAATAALAGAPPAGAPPIMDIVQGTGIELQQGALGGQLKLTLQLYADTPPQENVMLLSSTGALWASLPNGRANQDVRVKPDLIAPGHTLSAHSDNQYSGVMDSCSAALSGGTSMACPVAAAAALIARQYFVNGFYPSGAANPSASFQPSAALLRAVMTGGAAPMRGYSLATGKALQPPPDIFQGFGRVDLSRAVPLQDNTAWKLQVVDNAPLVAIGEQHQYTVTATGDGPLIVTLAWVDYPAFPGALHVLINNLDLSVSGGGATLWGNGGSQPDAYNNVERVYVAKPGAGDYTITVAAKYLFIGARPQFYALAVQGHFTGRLDSPYNPAPA